MKPATVPIRDSRETERKRVFDRRCARVDEREGRGRGVHSSRDTSEWHQGRAVRCETEVEHNGIVSRRNGGRCERTTTKAATFDLKRTPQCKAWPVRAGTGARTSRSSGAKSRVSHRITRVHVLPSRSDSDVTTIVQHTTSHSPKRPYPPPPLRLSARRCDANEASSRPTSLRPSARHCSALNTSSSPTPPFDLSRNKHATRSSCDTHTKTALASLLF